MGVYIKGMEMPKNCLECPMVSGYEIADEARTICSTVRCRLTNTKRPVGEAISPDCPLVRVPPHGRLIDADALYERAKLRSERFNGCFNDLDNVINALYIETFPTIIPAEEGET